jgi:flavin reductase (DIM6/NTAB) family NADH-FMN oxidoreductase RutF
MGILLGAMAVGAVATVAFVTLRGDGVRHVTAPASSSMPASPPMLELTLRTPPMLRAL